MGSQQHKVPTWILEVWSKHCYSVDEKTEFQRQEEAYGTAEYPVTALDFTPLPRACFLL